MKFSPPPNNKKKIAFIGDPWIGAIKRLSAFIKLSPPNYEFTFINAEEGMNDNLLNGRSNETIITPPLPKNVKSLFLSEFIFDDYDLVLPLNDKHFFKTVSPLRKKRLPGDLTNKITLNLIVERFSSPSPGPLSTIPINPTVGPVFVKPIVGAGQYTTDSLSYRRHDSIHIVTKDHPEEYNPNIHLIQEYFPTENTKINFVTFVSNGEHTLELIDFTEATHILGGGDSKTGKNINIHLESKLIEQGRRGNSYIQLAEDFIRFAQYDTIPGIFMLQFMTVTDGHNSSSKRVFLNDFNVRSGPAADHATVNGIFNHRIHSMIPFMLNDVEGGGETYPHIRYRCYLTDLITDIPLDPTIQQTNNRVLCVEDTQSGLIRNDYHTYIEILK
jgi:hypothetical protein